VKPNQTSGPDSGAQKTATTSNLGVSAGTHCATNGCGHRWSRHGQPNENWRGCLEIGCACSGFLDVTTLSDDLLLDNFHWSQPSGDDEKYYDLFRAELARRLQSKRTIPVNACRWCGGPEHPSGTICKRYWFGETL